MDTKNKKKSFIAYSDWRDTFNELTDEDAGKLVKHIFAYVNDENPTTDSVIIRAVFAQMKNAIDRDREKWEKQIEQRSKAGKKSAELRATKSNERSTVVNETQRNPTDSVSVSVSDSDSVSVSTNVDDMHPTLSEVMEKVLELYGEEVVHSMSEFFRTSAKAFFYHYDSQGWVKGNGMKLTNWETKLKEWVEKDRREQRPRPEQPKIDPAKEKAEYFKNAPIMGSKKKK